MKTAIIIILLLLNIQIGDSSPLLNNSTNISSNINASEITPSHDSCVHLRGLDGRDGRPGPAGPAGRDGLVGPQGPPGMQGPVGPAGPEGVAGPAGPEGAMGPAGPEGAMGPAGLAGPIGPAGPAGSPGLQGPPGLRGLRGPAGPPSPASRGVVYTRWGRSSCPAVAGTTMVYTGRVAGTYHTTNGGGANHLCLPPDPQYTLPTRSGVQNYIRIHGTEYEDPVQGTDDHNVPCAVCLASTRETVLMIPAKTTCPHSWTEEYEGYIMTERSYHSRSMFVCVDKSQQSVPGSSANTNGALLYHVEISCNLLQCPPYIPEKELTCVVCTK